MRVSDIEVWMNRTKKLESAQDIDIYKFRDLVSKFEVTLIRGQYLLPDELCLLIDKLFHALNNCLEVYDEECEKKSTSLFHVHPKIHLQINCIAEKFKSYSRR